MHGRMKSLKRINDSFIGRQEESQQSAQIGGCDIRVSHPLICAERWEGQVLNKPAATIIRVAAVAKASVLYRKLVAI
jgi:hypothetical protein